MRRLVSVLVSALIASLGLAVPLALSSARAAGVTTINGPALVGYYANVTLTGHAPSANAPVTIYYHRKNGVGYGAGATVTSDAAGNYSTTFRADTDYRYYAVSAGSTSAGGLTQVITPTCTVSAPAFTSLPTFPYAYPSSFDPNSPFSPFASFQATNSIGIWAGYTLTDSRLSVVSYSTITRALTVLGTYSYYGPSYEPGSNGSIQVAAVSAHGSVVVGVQRTNHNLEDGQFVGFVYVGAQRHQLSSAANWSSVRPIGLTNDGTIVGDVRVGPVNGGQHYVVTWANADAPYHVVIRNGGQFPFAAVNGNGDIGYIDSAGNASIRTASGTIVSPGPGQQSFGGGDGGSSLYGNNDGPGYYDQAQHWTVTNGASVISPAPLTVVGSDFHVTNVGSNGALVLGYGRTQHLLTRTGLLAAIPAQWMSDGPRTPVGVSAAGTVAFTSASDGLVHFFSCR